jgi:hypothetical protein
LERIAGRLLQAADKHPRKSPASAPLEPSSKWIKLADLKDALRSDGSDDQKSRKGGIAK